MTDRAAYIRGARLTIWTPRPDPTTRLGAFFGAVVPNALVVENLRITWSVKKDGTSKPNAATISINNLAETSRAEVGRLPKRMALEVGYNGRLRQLWVGDLTHATHDKDGVTWTTTLVGADGSRAFKHAIVNRSLVAGTTVLQAVREAATALGLQVPAAVTTRTDLAKQFVNGVALFGRAAAEMTKLLEPLGLSWSIQDGELVILDPVAVRPGDALVLDQPAGLIGSPSLGAPDKPGGRPKLSARCLVYPEIQPGRLLAVRSLTVNGRFRCEAVTHTGCNMDGDMMTELEAKPL